MKYAQKMAAIVLVFAILLTTTGCSVIKGEVKELVKEAIEELEQSETETNSNNSSTAEEVEVISFDEEKSAKEYEEELEAWFAEEEMDDFSYIETKLILKTWIATHDTEVFRPSIEYKGVALEPRMTITEELQTVMDEIEVGNHPIDDLGIDSRYWEELLTSPSFYYQGNLFHLEKLTFRNGAKYISCISVDREGASSNGIFIGDSYEKVFEVYPEAESLNVNNITDYKNESYDLTVYFVDGKCYAPSEYDTKYRSLKPTDEGWEEQTFRNKFDTYVLYFNIREGKVTRINVCDGLSLLYGR